VTSDSVTVSVIAGFSGPLAPVLEKAYQGMETWRDDVNDGGGIHGRKVVLKKVDHKETADGGVAACKEALSNGSLFAAVPEGVDATLSAIGCLDAAGMPTVYYSGTTDPKWKYAFADIMTSAQGGTLMGSYVSTKLGGAGKKVGVMYVNQPAYKAMADTFVPEAKRLGSSVVAVESVEPNQASFTSQLLKMQEAGVRILVISSTTETIGILRDAKSLGYAPTFTGWGFQFDFVTVGARNLFDGVTGLRTYATVDAPAYEHYAARMEARGRGRDRTQDLEGFPSYGHALVIGELLERAGPKPTRASVVAGAETVRDYDNGILPSITWGPGNHEGATGAFPTICCNADYTWKSQGPATARFS
jgi:branched-chain amino acid transport system substrate-binding protein